MYPPPPPPQWEDADPSHPAPPPLSPTGSTAPSLNQLPYNLAGDHVARTNHFSRAAGPVAAAAVPVPSHPPAHWSTGLFDCFDDVGNCCLTCLCPCVAFGQIAEIVDRGTTSCGASGALYAMILCLTGCSCMYSCFYRSKLRRQFFLQETPCADCLVHCCCESCALCQEYRELTCRGFDLRTGWKANMEKKRPALTPPPTMEGSMTR